MTGKKGITVTDAEGRETSVTDKSGDGSSGIQTTYTYDAKGRTREVKRYDKNKALEGRMVYTYDDATDAVLTMVDYQTENGTETPLRYTGYTYDDLSMLSGHISDIVASGTKKVIDNNKKWLKK